jgi:restriction endonuclease S subunit
MEHIEKGVGEIIEMPSVKGSEIKSQTIRVPHNFFLFGKLRPYLNKYWVNDKGFENVICSSEFFVFSIKQEEIHKDYFLNILSSRIIQEQISDLMAGARMPRINEDNFKNLQVPLPPLPIQIEIIDHIEVLRSKISQAKNQAKELRESAKKEFEIELFS